MNTRKILFQCILVSSIIFSLAGCGPSKTLQDATSTQAAVSTSKALTASAPTATRTSTATAAITLSPTFTPTPAPTKTLKPSPTFTATLPASGEYIAFSSDRSGFGGIHAIGADGEGEVILIAEHPYSDSSPSWSPDGKRIAFVSGRDSENPREVTTDVYIINADGTGLKRLTKHPANDGAPYWSPDGKQIAFVSDRDGNDEIYVMNANGGGEKRLTQDPAMDGGPAWSPDGKQIAFFSYQASSQTDIYVMDSDGSNVTRLTEDSVSDDQADWSPDGARLVFTSDRGGNFDIYSMNADGSDVRQLTTDQEVDQMPAWSPDGQQIVFSSYRKGHSDIFVMNADGSEQQQLTDDQYEDKYPSWSTPEAVMAEGPWFGAPFCARDSDGDFQPDLPVTAFDPDDTFSFVVFPFRNMEDGMEWSFESNTGDLLFENVGFWDGGESGVHVIFNAISQKTGEISFTLKIGDKAVQEVDCTVGNQ